MCSRHKRGWKLSQDRVLQLDDLLSGLQSEGRMVSSDTGFTVHHSKAKEKLKTFQLSNPSFYILKLVQAAVLANATEIEVSLAPHQVTLSHDGDLPQPIELKELLNYIFLSDKETDRHVRSLKRLASAVNTAVSAHARELSLECHGENESYQQVWSADGTEFRELKPSMFRGMRFLLKRKPGDVASSLRHVGCTRLVDLVQGNRNSVQKEEAALWDRAVFCSIPILLNGERLTRNAFGAPRYPDYDGNKKGKVPFFHWIKNRSHYLGRNCHTRYHLIQAYLQAEAGVRVSLRAPEVSHSFLVSHDHPHERDQLCSIIHGLEANQRFLSRVNFISEGVLIEQEARKGLPGGLFSLVSADHLRTDLSGFQLIKDKDYKRCLDSLHRSCKELVRELRSRRNEIDFRAGFFSGVRL